MSFVPKIRRAEEFDVKEKSNSDVIEHSIRKTYYENQKLIMLVIIIVILCFLFYFFREAITNFLIDKMPIPKRAELAKRIMDTDSQFQKPKESRKTAQAKPKREEQSAQQPAQQQPVQQQPAHQLVQQPAQRSDENDIKISGVIISQEDIKMLV